MRLCPQCGRQVPANLSAAFSDKLECPHCDSPLRVSDVTRIIGAFLALIVGALVWYSTRGPEHLLPWLLPEIYAFLSYSAVYALFVMATADLVSRPAETEQPVAAAPAAHGGTHGPHQ